MERRFEGDVACVTGASKGIGEAIARRLAAEGADVAITWFRDRTAAESIVADLRASGVRAHAARAVLRDPDLPGVVVRQVEEELGPITVLVANAATGVFRPVRELTQRHWDWAMQTNAASLLGFVRNARQLSRAVALSSLGATRATTGYGAVGASKAALEALVRQLAVELAPDLRINAISPGLVDSRSARHLFSDAEEILEGARVATPAQRLTTPDDVASLAAFLLSHEATMITGQTIVVDGGYSMQA